MIVVTSVVENSGGTANPYIAKHQPMPFSVIAVEL
jgi:hypothetical protein